MHLVSLDDRSPQVPEAAWVAPGVTLIGDVVLGDEASVWYGSVLRADNDRIAVGAGSNIQDGCVVHADPGLPVTVGTGVSVGHRSVLHGCTVGDDVLVGMGAVVLNRARIGAGSLVAAGAVVLEGAEIPPNSLVAGVPATVRRETTQAERDSIRTKAETYRELAAHYAQALRRAGTT